MKQQHSKFLIFLLTLGLLASQTMFAQSSKPVEKNQMLYSNSSSTNNIGSLTKVQPKEVEFSAEKKSLLQQLEVARTSNNVIMKQSIEDQLHKLDNTQSVQLIEDPNFIGKTVMTDGKPTGNGEPDYATTQIASGGFWASATQTTPTTFPVPGVIWVATTQYSNTGTDTCKFFFSTNGGANWTYAYLFYFGSNMDFRANELDIELVYDGSVVWIYGVAGYTDFVTNRTQSFLFRINTTANTYNGYTLLWPGNATTSNLYYNPRITSDNSNYTNLTYIYVSASFDSTGSASHINRQKYAKLTSPFIASPTIDYTMGSGNGGFFWNSGVPAGTYLWTDLAYFRTSTSANRIITVYNVPGSSNYNLYLAWSDDFGATVTGNSSIAEANVDYGARIAFNGGTTNYNGMIAYVRQFSGADWDPYYRATVDGGTTWTANYIDASSNRARTVDVIAVRGGANLFKVGYAQDSTAGVYAYYTGGNGATGFNQPSPLAISPVGADTTFTKVIAGYKNGGGDDCFAVYSFGGTNVYGSRLCQTTVGINENNHGIPTSYSLAQNYPNPFNPSTSIKFDLPKQGIVKLTVYDVLGNVVAVLANGNFEAGQHSISFDASNFASGIYLYKIEANGFSDVKKMMLIK